MIMLGVEKMVSAYASSLIKIIPPALSLLENDLDVIPENKNRRTLKPYVLIIATIIKLFEYPKYR